MSEEDIPTHKTLNSEDSFQFLEMRVFGLGIWIRVVPAGRVQPIDIYGLSYTIFIYGAAQASSAFK